MPRTTWWLVAILLIATSARLYDLEVRSLWADEGWTLVLAKGPTIPDIVQRMANDQHPPLYFIAIHLWRDLTGSSEFTLRLLSVFTGLVGVAALYQLGRMMFGPMAGMMAALFLALSDHHIDLTQDVRHYAQLATLIILSSWYYFRLIRNPTRSTRVGYVLLSATLLYSHYLGGFVLIVQVVHMLLFLRPWPRLRWALFHFGAVCAAFSPWFLIVLEQNRVRWETPLYYLNALPNSHQTYLMVRDALFGKQYAITLVLLAAGLVWISDGLRRSRLKLRPLSPVVFAVLWLVGYIAMTVYYNEQRQFLTVRNFIVVTPAIAVLVGHGLANLQASARTFMVAVLMVMSLTTVDTRQLKPPWRQVVQHVTDHHNQGEPVLMHMWVGDFPGRYYVEQQIGAPWLSIRETREEYSVQFLPYMLDYVRDLDAFWLIFWKSTPVDEWDYAGIFADAGFQRSATLDTDHAGDHIHVYRYDRRRDEDIATFGELFNLKDYVVLREGHTLRVQLLWTANQHPPLDYSVSVFLLAENGALGVNHDGQPLNGRVPTSTWAPDQLVFDQHRLDLGDLATGTYTLGVKIYYYTTPDQPLCVNADCEEWLVLQEVEVN